MGSSHKKEKKTPNPPATVNMESIIGVRPERRRCGTDADSTERLRDSGQKNKEKKMI